MINFLLASVFSAPVYSCDSQYLHALSYDYDRLYIHPKRVVTQFFGVQSHNVIFRFIKKQEGLGIDAGHICIELKIICPLKFILNGILGFETWGHFQWHDHQQMIKR